MSIHQHVTELATSAKQASASLANSPVSVRNAALQAIALQVKVSKTALLAANAEDLLSAKKKGLDLALIDRLELTDARIEAMLTSLSIVQALPDPIGGVEDLRAMASGIQVGKMRVPLGLIGIIYESRPNVTIDAASLCLKSGNAVLLRGGSEAIRSNLVLATCIKAGLTEAGLSEELVQVIDTTDRAAVSALVGLSGLVAEATVPVLKHLDGICHLYIHSKADVSMATELTVNSKTHRYGTCNTMETLLVDAEVASMLPSIAAPLVAKGVELRGCEKTCAILSHACNPASEGDWVTEYLAPILAIKVVDDFEHAIKHISTFGSGHTDGIVTACHASAMRFLRAVDSSSVMVNTSTRFADGFEYGLGAEIGISTDKIHARGPVGLEGLTSQKYVVLGNGHTRH